jgi:drug/metabolite transporter (DMT)-like permease
MVEITHQDQQANLKLSTSAYMKEEGPIPHFSIIKLASLDIISSFALTIGFSIIGSGMYQVIYSSVVIWCAIFTWFFMGRALSQIQWLAIIGTSIGLGISSLDSIRGSSLQTDVFATSTNQEGILSVNCVRVILCLHFLLYILDTTRNALFNGTLMTLGGTLISGTKKKKKKVYY